MTVSRAHYETLLANYSSQAGAIALLRKYRPYLEKVPSMRRPKDSLISIPLPLARVQPGFSDLSLGTEAMRLPSDIALLMCDPEWKIKTGIEIFVFIHRPQEDFSQLLDRWRQTQILIERGYEWLMPQRYQHILNDGGTDALPLFVVFPQTPERIRKGLKGAYLPVIMETVSAGDGNVSPTDAEDVLLSPELPASDNQP